MKKKEKRAISSAVGWIPQVK